MSPLRISSAARRRAALALTVPLLAVATACGSGSGTHPSQSPTTPIPTSSSASSPTTGSPTTGNPTATGTVPGTTPPSSATPTAPLGSPVNLPLWPFATLAQAQAWESAYASGGHQPWHLDAGQTALAFTQGYLGFADIGRVTSTTVSGRDAHIGVGYSTPATPPSTATAAVIHLVRYGSDSGAPWEVVGTADTTLTLTVPAYGATIASPVTVGGAITGVDESIRVQIRQLSGTAPLADRPGLPAGGTATPWHTTVTYAGATDPVLTIVASTGGHLMAVERFAITGVRTR